MVTEAQLSHYWLYFFRKLLFNQQLLIQKILGQRCKATTLKSIAVSKYHCYCLFFQKTTAIAYFFKRPLPLLIFSKDHCHCLFFQKTTAIAYLFKRSLLLLIFLKDHCHCLLFQKTPAIAYFFKKEDAQKLKWNIWRSYSKMDRKHSQIS